MSRVSNLASFPFVRMCQIDGSEGIKKFGDDPLVTLGDIVDKREGGIAPPPASRGLKKFIRDCINPEWNTIGENRFWKL